MEFQNSLALKTNYQWVLNNFVMGEAIKLLKEKDLLLLHLKKLNRD